MTGNRRHTSRILITTWLVAVLGACACYSPRGRDFSVSPPASFAAIGPLVPPRSTDAESFQSPTSAVETWVIQTRACEQKLGTDPWSSINIGRLDEQGGPIHGGDPEALLARMSGRTSVFFIHGSGYTY